MNHPPWHVKSGWRRRKLAGAAAAVAAAVTLLGTAGTGPAAARTTGSTVTPAYDVLSAAQNGMHTLMGSYNPANGLIGNVWWQSAVALSTLMTYQQATGDTQYSSAISTAFNDNKSGNFENTFTDDTGWWGLVWLQAYQITGSTQYLQMAETDANYIHQYWDSTCGGGVWWHITDETYKAAISNELFLDLTAGLHNAIPGDTTYLNWANAEWSWLDTTSGLIGSNGLVGDGDTPTSPTGCTASGTTWTYNQGVILAGLTQLSKATGNSSLLTEAQNIADAAILKLNATGVLNEICTGTSCGSDAQSFKGIFVRGLKDLSNALNTEWYASFFENQVNSIIPNDTNSGNQMGFLWQGPVSDPNTSPNDGITSYSQASAEDALVAGLNLGDNGTVLAQAKAGLCLDDYGSGRTAGTKIDVWQCNSSPGQSWSAPAFGVTGELHIMNGCATVNGGTANGTKVVWDACTGSADQEWTRKEADGSTSYSTLYNAWSGKCMDNTGDSSTNGNPIQVWTCNSDTAQTWQVP